MVAPCRFSSQVRMLEVSSFLQPSDMQTLVGSSCTEGFLLHCDVVVEKIRNFAVGYGSALVYLLGCYFLLFCFCTTLKPQRVLWAWNLKATAAVTWDFLERALRPGRCKNFMFFTLGLSRDDTVSTTILFNGTCKQIQGFYLLWK